MTLTVFEATEALVLAARASLVGHFEDASPAMQHLADALDDYDAARAAQRKAMDEVTHRLNVHMAGVLRKLSPNYRYWEHNGIRYCYTTERDTDGKWYAFTAGASSKQRRVKCATRTKAKARAHSWYVKAKT